MVGTPPYQKRGKCGHWMPSFDKHMRCYSCRMHCKGEDPCASGAPLEACSSCSSLTEVEWNHLRTVFQERSAKRAAKSQPAKPDPDNSEEESETGEIDDFILDLNTDETQHTSAGETGYTSPTGVSAPAGLSPLQPALGATGLSFLQPNMPPPRSAAFHTVPVSSASTVFFKTLAPPKPNLNQDPVFATASDPRRLVPPPTLHTQMLKTHFDQQNMQMMENLSQQNQKQIQDLSSQLQSGLQQFLASSMEQMFKKFSPQTPQSGHRRPSATYSTGSDNSSRTDGYFYSTGCSCYQKRAKRGQGLFHYRTYHHQGDSISSTSSSNPPTISI